MNNPGEDHDNAVSRLSAEHVQTLGLHKRFTEFKDTRNRSDSLDLNV
ncbi:hypothetical protein [Bifidobacterium aquikefiricola]|uniref:Uncharacterized protein n=1 Tax=Bifidobacterium aquikefiricola TaxID=3059038 RepID=A0AB39U5R6_9BIFI